MSQKNIAQLEVILNSAAENLSSVTSKKMFGCHALWTDGNVFALVWKHGRIGVKLPTESAYESLMSISGAAPWKAGPMQMSHWVLVPEAYHAKTSDLKKWLAKAHDLCSKLEKRPIKKPVVRKTAVKKPAAKKTAKKKAL